MAEKNIYKTIGNIGKVLSGFSAGYKDPAGAFRAMNQQLDPMQQMTMALLANTLGKTDTVSVTRPDSKEIDKTISGLNTDLDTSGIMNPSQSEFNQFLANQPPSLMFKPTNFVIDPRYQSQLDIATAGEKEKVTKKAERLEKISESLGTSKYNFSLVSQTMHDMANIYSDMLDEGSAGNFWKKNFANLAAKGIIPGMQDKFTNQPKLTGKITEAITKMMPMLTQQIGKEGSVRLVTTVYDQLRKTISSGEYNAEQAKGMMEETMRSMFRVVRTLDQLNADENMANEMGDDFAEYILSESQRIKLSPEEEKNFNKLVNETLSPLNKGSKKDNNAALKRMGLNPDKYEIVE